MFKMHTDLAFVSYFRSDRNSWRYLSTNLKVTLYEITQCPHGDAMLTTLFSMH